MNATDADEMWRAFTNRERAGTGHEAHKLRAALRAIAADGCEMDPEYPCHCCNPCTARDALESEAR